MGADRPEPRPERLPDLTWADGVHAALAVIDGHGWLGVSHTVRRELLGYTGPEAVEESELRAWRASPPTHPHPPSRPGAAGSSHK